MNSHKIHGGLSQLKKATCREIITDSGSSTSVPVPSGDVQQKAQRILRREKGITVIGSVNPMVPSEPWISAAVNCAHWTNVGEYFVNIRMCVFCNCWVEYSININHFKLLIVRTVEDFVMLTLMFCLSYLSVTDWGVFRALILIVDLSISHFSPLFASYILNLLLDEYTVKFLK